MVDLILPPDPRTLLPPLLACLPAAFVSPRPPPALLPLLSPILRQRVQIFTSVSDNPTESWLRLLCWDAAKAERLQSVVDSANFEAHPVSGEIELPDDVPVAYRRLDKETLQARILLPEYNIRFIYLWCPNDKDGGGPGWRVAELLPDDNSSGDDGPWYLSIADANLNANGREFEDALVASDQRARGLAPEEEEDDDNDYWARYDATPGRTPSVNPPSRSTYPTIQQPADSELSYFARYGDVQPAMDNHDPSEEQPEWTESSLNGNVLADLLQRRTSNSGLGEPARVNGYLAAVVANSHNLNHPRPSSVSSTSSDAVAKLEQEAESQSACEMGVKQHIGANIKSLFRLAKTVGMSRADFDSLVKTELELLSLSDDD